ncbi:dihydrolipoamide acetyltransferase family protein [soil metagenome]
MAEFRLPDLGEGVAEGEIDRWLVAEGDEIAEDDPLVEIITDKATVEIPSPFAGAVARIHVEAGAVVPVGTVLVTIGNEVLDPSVAAPAVSEQDAPEVSRPPEQALGDAPERRVRATPPVRSLARDLGIDLAVVQGSGPAGRILREDVEAVAKTPVEPARQPIRPSPLPSAPAPGGRREPLRGIRRTIAERMSEAHRTVPPVTHVEECDVTELDATRRFLNERGSDGVRLTFIPFIVKAVVAGLKAYPALNATLDERAGDIVYHDAFNIGVAVDTPDGLVVPVVEGADRKSLREIGTEVAGLAERARAGALLSDDLRGGTFTVTSPGPFGGLLATPIVLHPQVGILGVHRATDRPVVRDGHIVVRKMMNLSITFDHRVLDGLTAAKFALEVAQMLEHPAAIALER